MTDQPKPRASGTDLSKRKLVITPHRQSTNVQPDARVPSDHAGQTIRSTTATRTSVSLVANQGGSVSSGATSRYNKGKLDTKTNRTGDGQVEFINDDDRKIYEMYVADCTKFSGKNRSKWSQYDLSMWTKAFGGPNMNQEAWGIPTRKEPKKSRVTLAGLVKENTELKAQLAGMKATFTSLAEKMTELKELQHQLKKYKK